MAFTLRSGISASSIRFLIFFFSYVFSLGAKDPLSHKKASVILLLFGLCYVFSLSPKNNCACVCVCVSWGEIFKCLSMACVSDHNPALPMMFFDKVNSLVCIAGKGAREISFLDVQSFGKQVKVVNKYTSSSGHRGFHFFFLAWGVQRGREEGGEFGERREGESHPKIKIQKKKKRNGYGSTIHSW